MSDTASTPAPRPIAWFRNKFLAGLALVIPLVVTFWILKVIYDFLHGMSAPLLEGIAGVYNGMVAPRWQVDVAGDGFSEFTSFVGFLAPVIVVVVLGVIVTNVIGARLVHYMDRLLMRIPVISAIYKALRQVMEAFKGFGGAKGFKRVVYVEYPSPGMWLIGFATGQFHDAKLDRMMTCVFLPTAPSPMTGFVIVADSTKVTDATLTVEEAMKMILSGGLIRPDGIAGKPPPPLNAVPKRPLKPQPVEFAGLPKADDHPDTIAPNEDDADEVLALAGDDAPRGWFGFRRKKSG